MRRLSRLAGLAWGFPILWAAQALGADTPPMPFTELYQRIRDQLPSMSDADFEAQAKEALIRQFRGTVLPAGTRTTPTEDTPAVASRRRLEGPAAWIRIGEVRLALAPQLSAALADTNLMHGIHGLILDLRFAGGSDYAAATAAAGLFLREDQPVLDWGDGPRRAPGNPEAFDGPVIVLVNRETSGAAEALAAALQRTRTALVIGRPTAGQAAVFREFDLPDGGRLRLPVSRVATGDGQPIPETGLAPDILVRSQPDHERSYVEDPFRPAPGTHTSAAARRKISEADLVRARREGRRPEAVEADAAEKKPESAPGIQDPALVRALDLLQGLQLLQPGS